MTAAAPLLMPTSKSQVSIEQEIKRQFARVFRGADSPLFKETADYYFRRAATLKRADIQAQSNVTLLIRNIQKRLFIGIGTELLLKALYLRNDFAINKPRNPPDFRFPIPLRQARDADLLEDNTYTLNELIDGLPKLGRHFSAFLLGLKIAKVFRNKEGHVVTPQHTFVRAHYTDIERALTGIYECGFSERLTVRFSLAPNEKAVWRVTPPNPRIHTDARKSSARG